MPFEEMVLKSDLIAVVSVIDTINYSYEIDRNIYIPGKVQYIQKSSVKIIELIKESSNLSDIQDDSLYIYTVYITISLPGIISEIEPSKYILFLQNDDNKLVTFNHGFGIFKIEDGKIHRPNLKKSIFYKFQRKYIDVESAIKLIKKIANKNNI